MRARRRMGSRQSFSIMNGIGETMLAKVGARGGVAGLEGVAIMIASRKSADAERPGDDVGGGRCGGLEWGVKRSASRIMRSGRLVWVGWLLYS